MAIIPVDGTVLANPYYVPPGPKEHMILVRGYDATTDQFIANDPGTKMGAGFRYSSQVIGAALFDYDSGYHEETSTEKTAMIVISRMDE